LNIAIEIVDLPIENGDFPQFFVTVYQRVSKEKAGDGSRTLQKFMMFKICLNVIIVIKMY